MTSSFARGSRSGRALFTGLVQELGSVAEVATRDGQTRIRVEASLATDLREGDSVAVNGVCLTAVEPGPAHFEADLSAETVARTALGSLAPGEQVNLELPLRPADRLGGHIVQGHVDGVGQVSSIADAGGGREVRVDAPAALLRYVVEKGSIAVDGVSLTVTSVDDEGFAVALIPETLERTTLGRDIQGRPVNLEVDVIAKHVEKLVGKI
jgi:riboflavin synthase